VMAAQAHAMTREPQGDCFAPEALFFPSGTHPEPRPEHPE